MDTSRTSRRGASEVPQDKRQKLYAHQNRGISFEGTEELGMNEGGEKITEKEG